MRGRPPTQKQLGYMHRLIKAKGLDEQEFYVEMGFKTPTLWGYQLNNDKITTTTVSYAINRLLKMKREGK